MKAHVLNENGLIINTVVVDSLDAMPNLVDASLGGSIGDSIVDGVITPKPPAPPIVPQEVTMRQARRALFDAGLLGNVDAAILTLPSPEKECAQIDWDYSSTVQRDRYVVELIGVALGLDSAGLDNLFITAAAIL